jgi:hypothetical protein
MRLGRAQIIPVFVCILILGSFFPTTFCSNQGCTSTIHESVTSTMYENKIVMDYSHGQLNATTAAISDDALLVSELEARGYTVVRAIGGLNSSILSDADGLLVGSIIREEDAFLASEISAIANWFNSGPRFLWIGCDSDFTGTGFGQFINDNMSLILESVGSHVYPEPTWVQDPYSNCLASYRVVANQTSDDPLLAEVVNGVEAVLMHSPTLVYGSNNTDNPGVGVDPVALEEVSIDNVYPVLYYSDFATICDNDIQPPIVHEDGQIGAFVATTLELRAGTAGAGVIVVSGASPYADYRPMYANEYYGVTLDGSRFVNQVIDFGMNQLAPSIDTPSDIICEEGVLGYSITWDPRSATPNTYNITFDDILVREGKWNSTHENISVSLSGLSIGSYNYTLTVIDSFNQTSSDTVAVFVESPTAPIVNHPANITYIEGEIGNIIEWSISDTSLKNYSIYLDGVPLHMNANIISQEPLTLEVPLVVDGYSLGLYNFTILVFDYLDLNTSDTVWINVLSPTSSTTTTSLDTNTSTNNETRNGDILAYIPFILSIGSMIVIVLVVILIARKR